MNIYFNSTKLQKKCSRSKDMIRAWGPEISKKIQLRLKEIEAATNLQVLSYLPQARCHQLKGNRDNQFAVDLKHPFRLIFEPYHDPAPLKEDGGFDLVEITDILIIEVEDYHGK